MGKSIMNTETKEIIKIIIETIEDYKSELARRPDVKQLSAKYQQGLQDGMTLIIKRLEGVLHE